MSSGSPLISVIIPAYNHAQFVEEAVESVLSQTYKHLEVIVVDDGSTDDTRDILKKYQNKLTYIFQKNNGQSSARNHGIRTGKGTYIAFLDSDDLWLPEKLELQMEVMSQNQTIGLVSCGAYIINPKGRIEDEWIREEYQTREKLLRDLQTRKLFLNTSCVLVKRMCLDRVGEFKEGLGFAEDWDLWLRIARHYEVRIIRKPLIKCRKHDGFKGYQQVKIMRSSICRIINDNLNGEGWRIRGEAYSFMYADLAGLCLQKNRKWMAAVYALRSLLSYPLRLRQADYRFKLLMKALLPDFLYSAIKRIREKYSCPK